jgi:hypothetical protein
MCRDRPLSSQALEHNTRIRISGVKRNSRGLVGVHTDAAQYNGSP